MREELGIARNDTVLCNFLQTCKIEPVIFGRSSHWMPPQSWKHWLCACNRDFSPRSPEAARPGFPSFFRIFIPTRSSGMHAHHVSTQQIKPSRTPPPPAGTRQPPLPSSALVVLRVCDAALPFACGPLFLPLQTSGCRCSPRNCLKRICSCGSKAMTLPTTSPLRPLSATPAW